MSRRHSTKSKTYGARPSNPFRGDPYGSTSTHVRRSEPPYRSNSRALLPTTSDRVQRVLRLAASIEATYPHTSLLKRSSEPFYPRSGALWGRPLGWSQTVGQKAPTRQLPHRSLPVPREALGIRAPSKVKFCVARKIRKEVLHALGRVGRGSGTGPRHRTQDSQYSCSRR